MSEESANAEQDSAAGHFGRGNALMLGEKADEAITAFRQAIVLHADFPEAWCNLGSALQAAGRLDEALAACNRAVELNPNFPEAYCNLGVVLKETGQLDAAISALSQAIRLRPGFAQAWCNLGNVLTEAGQFEPAIAACRRAISLRPNYAEAYCNLANALQAAGKIVEAIAACGQAISLKPDCFQAYGNLGNALKTSGNLPAAIAAYRRGLVLKPDSPELHRNLALALLADGDFDQGWAEYEWRWQCRELASAVRNFGRPMWNGQPLAGATLLLHAEQGLGDTLQFIRYVKLAAGCGGKIIIECQPGLKRLLQTMTTDCAVFARGEALPAFDAHCPLLSLPHIFRTRLENVPCEVPYLHADVEMIRLWKNRIRQFGNGFHAGLAWAGSKLHQNDRHRSIPLSAFAPLQHLSGVAFHGLQNERGPNDTPPPDMTPIDWQAHLADFTDTAALIANLDLVISVDTAVAHLAGAMGKPVWLLLPFNSDWRWLQHREDSPWYPTMRLFRQPAMGDWESVIRRVAAALRERVEILGYQF